MHSGVFFSDLASSEKSTKWSGRFCLKILLTFIRTHTESLSKSKLEEDEILVDSIMFRLIQVAENSEKLTEKFKKTYPSIPWRAIKGLRNRIVHEYGNVDLTIVYDTVKKDIPELIGILEGICRCKKE